MPSTISFSNIRSFITNIPGSLPPLTERNVKGLYLPIFTLASVASFLALEIVRSHHWFAKAETIATFTDRQRKHIQELQRAIVEQDFTEETWNSMDQSEELASGVPKEKIYLVPILATRSFKALSHNQSVSREHSKDIASLRTLFGMLQVLNATENGIEGLGRKLISFLLLIPRNNLMQSLINSFDAPASKGGKMRFYFSKTEGVLQQRYEKALTFVKEKRREVTEPETVALDLCMRRLTDVAYRNHPAAAVEKSVNKEIFKCMLGHKSEAIPRDVLLRFTQIIDQDIVDIILNTTPPAMHQKIADHIENIASNCASESLSEQALDILNKFLVIRLLLPEKFKVWCDNNSEKAESVVAAFKYFEKGFDELSKAYLSDENKELMIADLEVVRVLEKLKNLQTS